MSYDRLNWSNPIPEKDISKKERYRRLESIYKLPLPMDVISNLVLLYKYETLVKRYKKNYSKVVFELKKIFRKSRLLERMRVTSPSHVPFYPEKQVACQISSPPISPCPPATLPYS